MVSRIDMTISGILSLAGSFDVPLASMQARYIGIVGYGVLASESVL